MKYYTVEGNKKSISKVFIIYFACMMAFSSIRIISSIGVLYSASKFADAIYSLIIQIGILFLLPFVLYMTLIKIKPKEVFEHCNYFKISITVILISVVLGILSFIINVAVSTLFNGILVFTGYKFPTGGGGEADYSIGNFFFQLFLVAALPALCEEFLHRGIILQGTKHIGFGKSIIISSLLFALMHFNIQQTFYAFVVGLIMGFVAVVGKNIWPAIIIHFVNNACAVYLDFAAARGWLFGDFLSEFNNFLSKNNLVIIFIAVSFVMIVVVSLLCVFIWLLYRQALVRKVNKAINKAYENFSMSSVNRPIKLGGEEHDVIVDLLESSTLLNLEAKVLENPIVAVMPKEKSRYMPSLMDRLFLWGSIMLGTLITLFTYIWGLF